MRVRNFQVVAFVRWSQGQVRLYTSDTQLEKLAANKRSEAAIHLSNNNIGDYAKAMVVAELAGKLSRNEAVLLTDLFEIHNDILTKNGHEEISKSAYLLSHLEKELESHVRIIFMKGCRRPGYMIVRNEGDLHHATYCALMDQKENTTYINSKGNQTDEKADSFMEFENDLLSSFKTAIYNQARL